MKTEEELKIESNIRVNDTTKRTVSDQSFDFAPETLSLLNQHTEDFNARVIKAEQERVKKFDPASGV